MKVLGISGSMKRDGNTAAAVNTVLETVAAHGIETELVQLWDKEIGFCTGCWGCEGKRNCTAMRDDFQKVFEKLLEADGMVLGSPVYSADVSAKMKAFLERAACVSAYNGGLLRHKAGCGVSVLRRGGGLAAVDTLTHFMMSKQMFIVGGSYWNMVYAHKPGDVAKDAEGLSNMRSLGENMAFLLACIGARETAAV